jgi:hypothetical protein
MDCDLEVREHPLRQLLLGGSSQPSRRRDLEFERVPKRGGERSPERRPASLIVSIVLAATS